jgi:mono/diheme cytochrome c family protein
VHLVLEDIMKRLVFPLLVLGMLTSGCQQKAEEVQTPQISAGQQLFLNNCVNCHQGAGAPPGPNAVIQDSEKLADETAFRTFLRNPNVGMMPAFTPERLSDADVHTLYLFVTEQSGRTPVASPTSSKAESEKQ